jgi:hypothetical protein
MSRTFPTRAGSDEGLNVSARCGRRPKARRMRAAAVRLMPARRAIGRVRRCVAFLGASSSVGATGRSTASSPMVRGAPERGASASPSSRCSAKRRRQVATVRRLTPGALAAPRSVAPGPAQVRTTRMRCARARPAPRRRGRRRSSARSAVRRSSTGAFGPRDMARLPVSSAHRPAKAGKPQANFQLGALAVAGCDLPEGPRGRPDRLDRRHHRGGGGYRRPARDRGSRAFSPCTG